MSFQCTRVHWNLCQHILSRVILTPLRMSQRTSIRIVNSPTSSSLINTTQKGRETLDNHQLDQATPTLIGQLLRRFKRLFLPLGSSPRSSALWLVWCNSRSLHWKLQGWPSPQLRLGGQPLLVSLPCSLVPQQGDPLCKLPCPPGQWKRGQFLPRNIHP